MGGIVREYLRTDWECPYCESPIPSLRGASADRAVDAMERHLDRFH